MDIKLFLVDKKIISADGRILDEPSFKEFLFGVFLFYLSCSEKYLKQKDLDLYNSQDVEKLQKMIENRSKHYWRRILTFSRSREYMSSWFKTLDTKTNTNQFNQKDI